MIDHVTLNVSDLERSKNFYERAFAPLNYKISFGEEGSYWAFDTGNGLFEIQSTNGTSPLTRVHVAFRAKDKNEVNAFYQAAIAAGAKENGAPGPRPEYSSGYYACFILDPDGYNIEMMMDAPN